MSKHPHKRRKPSAATEGLQANEPSGSSASSIVTQLGEFRDLSDLRLRILAEIYQIILSETWGCNRPCLRETPLGADGNNIVGLQRGDDD